MIPPELRQMLLRIAGRRNPVHVEIADALVGSWTQGEPPRDNPAYYLRFCKSFSRMGGTMHYVQADNIAFLHHLFHQLARA